MSIKGRMFTGKLEGLANTIREKFLYATLSKQGSGKVALDVVQKKYAQVSTANVVEAGSTNNLLKLTAHGLKEGYMIRLTSTANSIIEDEVLIDQIIDANFVELAAFLSADLVAGDTFDIYKPVSERVASDGSSLSTLIAPPIQIYKNGIITSVADDANPALIVPIPMKLVDFSGNTITLNAGDINVHLDDVGANFDRVRIGDGVNQLGITANSEAKTHDADALAQLLLLVAKDFATAGKQDAAKTVLDALAAKDYATETTMAVVAAKDFATSTKQDTLIAGVVDVENELIALNLVDFSTEAKQDLQITQATNTNTKLDTIIAKDFSTATLQTTQSVLLGAVNEASPAADTNASGLNGRLQRIAQRLTSLIALLPSSIGQKLMAGSMSVTIASDQTAFPVTPAQLAPTYNESLVVSNAGVTTIAAPAGAKGCKIVCPMSNASYLNITLDGVTAPSATVGIEIQPGRDFDFIGVLALKVIAIDAATNQKISVHWYV